MEIKIFLYIIFILFTSLISAYIGAISLGIFHISFKTVLLHWEIFKKELFMPSIENGQIINPNIFNQIEISVSSLLILSHNISNLLSSMGMSLFENSVFLNLSAGFISGGGGEGSGEGNSSLLYNIIYHINNINWSVLSIVLLIFTLKGPYAVHSIIHEIKDHLLLNENIWNNNNEIKLCERTKNLIQRIEGIQIHRIGQQLFNLVFIAQMVLLWLLVANSKYLKNNKEKYL
uniref:7TM_GPCR_Srx domain-containing protein n=1 Tax=Meloidogyne hapla TaxID=6305 RepID=A0A1I8B4Z4_MELHA